MYLCWLQVLKYYAYTLIVQLPHTFFVSVFTVLNYLFFFFLCKSVHQFVCFLLHFYVCREIFNSIKHLYYIIIFSRFFFLILFTVYTHLSFMIHIPSIIILFSYQLVNTMTYKPGWIGNNFRSGKYKTVWATIIFFFFYKYKLSRE